MTELREIVERSLGSEYEILSLIGRGGMGSVYLARERRLHRLVAIKVLPPDRESDRDRFLREARTVAKLSHPGIVSLHSFGESDELTYFVMDYVRGESLADRLRSRGPLGADEARRILAETAIALDHAHRNGVVHRDIKPENILVEEESGRVLITDFGIARVTGATTTLTADGLLLGTPRYMSPEQASGGPDVDARSDLYSLGLVGYALLSGAPPFDADDVRTLIADHVVTEPRPLAEVAPETPLALAAIVMRCLAKQPSDRWPTARQLYDALGIRPPEQIEDWEKTLRGGALRVALGVLAAVDLVLTVVLAPLNYPVTIFMIMLLTVLTMTLLMPAVNPILLRRRFGVAPDIVRRLFLMPPVNWIGWWPARWRPEGDLFGRLPPELRFRRIAFVILRTSLLLFAQLWYLALIIDDGRNAWRHSLTFVFWYGGVGLVLLTAGILLVPVARRNRRFFRRAREQGVQRVDLLAIISRPSFDLEFWRRPEISRVLESVPQPDPLAPQGEFSPRTYLEQIESVARALPEPAASVGRELLSLASQAVESYESIGRELDEIEREHHADELEHVERRLQAMSNDAVVPSERAAAMRALLVAQRDLLRDAAARLEVLRVRRADLRRKLQGHVTRLRRIAETSSTNDVALLVADLRPLCAPAVKRAPTERVSA